MGLLFYDASNGTGAFYSVDDHGNIALLREDDGWSKNWSQIVPTGIPIPPDDLTPGLKHLTLLFYDPIGGGGELYSHDDAGNMALIQSYPGWSHNWTQILPGNWGGTRGLLFYSASEGVGQFYSLDAQGNMALMKTNTGWSHNWTWIVAGSWNPPETGLLFYDDLAGVGEFYNVDNQGTISLLQRHEGWRHSWGHNIIPIGLLGTTGNQSLLFYDQLAGEGEFYNVDAQGNINLIYHADGWSHTWGQIVSLFDVSKSIPQGDGESILSRNGLLFYDGLNGVGEFYVLDELGHINLIRQQTGWRKSWANILEPDMLRPGKSPGAR